jgi:hypothetical protein
MRDDAATEIAGIRINVFTATFVFIGAVVYMLLAPKGRENPVSLRGKQPAESGEESLVEELAEDLVAAAKGSGIIAAATVAGEREAEDAVAVGDVESDDIAEIVVESDDIAEIVVDEAPDEAPDEALDEVPDEALGESLSAALNEAPHEAMAVDEIAVETDAEADEAEDDVEIVYSGQDTERQAVDDEAEFAADTHDTAIVVVYESEHSGAVLPDVVLEPEPVVEMALEPESEWVPEADAEADAEDGQERKSEAVAEPQPEPGSDDPDSDDPDSDESAKLKGSTLKRLLWGADSRGD